MQIRRMNQSSTGARGMLRTGVVALGAAAALALSGCADPESGGAASGGSVPDSPSSSASTAPSQESDDMASSAPDDGKRPEAADMKVAAGNNGRGLPPGLKGNPSSKAGVAWSPEPGLLYVVTYGSSSCPTVAEPQASTASTAGKGGVAAADAVLAVKLVESNDGICTMDYVPTTTVVETPAEADTGAPVTVKVGQEGKVEVQPRATEGEVGPVAWIDS